MIERLATDVLQDDYFTVLYTKAAKLFANILSNSKNPVSRNKAYQIITLLNQKHKANPYYQTFAHSVLAKLGNFPAIEYLKNEDENVSELPFERDIEKKVKEFIQAVPDTEDLF